MADEPVQESRREERRAERLQQARGTVKPDRVRVLPRDDEFRKSHRNVVGHPNFPEQGSVEWPNDQYTKRRVRDGDVTIEEPQAEPQQQQVERQASAPETPRASRNLPPTSPNS
jgi:hypothetical protein